MKPDLDKCKNGHFKTESTVYVHPKTGRESCRLCKRMTSAKIRARETLLEQNAIARLAEVQIWLK